MPLSSSPSFCFHLLAFVFARLHKCCKTWQKLNIYASLASKTSSMEPSPNPWHCLCWADLVFRMSSQCNFSWNSFGTYGKEEVCRFVLMCTSLLHVLTDQWQTSDCQCLMYTLTVCTSKKACWIKWSEECRETKSRSVYSQLAFLYSFPY